MKILCTILICSGVLMITAIPGRGQDTTDHLNKNKAAINRTNLINNDAGVQYSPGSLVKFNSMTSLFLYRKFYPYPAHHTFTGQMTPASFMTNKTSTDIDLRLQPYNKSKANWEEFYHSGWGSLLFPAFNKNVNLKPFTPYNASNPLKKDK